MKDIFGKPPISKFLFITGKLSMLLCIGSIIIQIFGFNLRIIPLSSGNLYASMIFGLIGLLILFVGMLNLGPSLKVGLPRENTYLRTNGLYKFSRNPIYLAIILLIFSSVIFTLNPVVAFLGMYGIIIQHMIILSEEKFLKDRFGKEYEAYFKKVRRYI